MFSPGGHLPFNRHSAFGGRLLNANAISTTGTNRQSDSYNIRYNLYITR